MSHSLGHWPSISSARLEHAMSCTNRTELPMAFLVVSISALVTTLTSGIAASAEKTFTGQDAAYVDWAFKNCEVTATSKERDLVQHVAAGSGDAFQQSYEKQYRVVVEQTRDAGALRRTCSSVKEWYGVDGNRIDGLIAVKGGSPVAASPGGDAKPAARAEPKHKGSGRHALGRSGM
jgi:hypothetical protein